jgi:hypothetical protein
LPVSWIWSKLHFAKLTITDLEIRDTPRDVQCSIISEDLCKIFNKDPYTIVLSIWAAFQLTWVTMLLCVQLLQVARNLTTYESMRGHLHSHTPADALNSFVTTGDTSQDVAGGDSATNGFGSGQDTGDAPRPRQPKHSIATALQGSQAGQRQQRGNPWSRGIVTNCKDFFCDGSPMFGRREGGYARLAGDRVDYTRLYEVPKMRYARSGNDGARYESVAAEEEAA